MKEIGMFDTLDSFKEASKPLIEWLNENVHAHHVAIVTGSGAELLEGVLGTGNVYDTLASTDVPFETG